MSINQDNESFMKQRYLDFNNQDDKKILTTLCQEVSFPLSDEDQQIIQILESQFDHEEDCAGLAAPQIGFNKQIIVFSVPEDEDLKRWRTDLTDTMPKTLWINPSYISVQDEMVEDVEGCFSVPNLVGEVFRFKKIEYQAYTSIGEKVQGMAEGFLARVIQHEIDHVNGKLYIDLVPEDKIKTREEYRAMRAEKMDPEKDKD